MRARTTPVSGRGLRAARQASRYGPDSPTRCRGCSHRSDPSSPDGSDGPAPCERRSRYGPSSPGNVPRGRPDRPVLVGTDRHPLVGCACFDEFQERVTRLLQSRDESFAALTRDCSSRRTDRRRFRARTRWLTFPCRRGHDAPERATDCAKRSWECCCGQGVWSALACHMHAQHWISRL
jgi:hypothetical protein